MRYLSEKSDAKEIIDTVNELIRIIGDYEENEGSPIGVITPKEIGDWCLDTTNNVWYRATGETSADWV